MKPFPFFVGTNGSGTTLHRAIFDSHPDLAIPGEARFVAKLADRYRAQGYDTERFLKDLGKDDRFENWGLDADDIEMALNDPPAGDYPEAVRRVYGLYAGRARQDPIRRQDPEQHPSFAAAGGSLPRSQIRPCGA